MIIVLAALLLGVVTGLRAMMAPAAVSWAARPARFFWDRRRWPFWATA